jgi:multidrug efflux pump subunit AcrA (membrane-fusion protein)
MAARIARRAVLMVAALTVRCSGTPPAPAAPPPPDVDVVHVVQRDVPVYLESIGVTRGDAEIEVRARVEGVLLSVNFAEGRMVKKGDLLYTIDLRENDALQQAKAFREVADTLVPLQKVRERMAQRQVQVTASREALRLSGLRYNGGVADYLEVLDAQRVSYLAEIDLTRSRQDELQASVRLYRALGGGWSDDELRRVIEAPSEVLK